MKHSFVKISFLIGDNLRTLIFYNGDQECQSDLALQTGKGAWGQHMGPEWAHRLTCAPDPACGADAVQKLHVAHAMDLPYMLHWPCKAHGAWGWSRCVQCLVSGLV